MSINKVNTKIFFFIIDLLYLYCFVSFLSSSNFRSGHFHYNSFRKYKTHLPFFSFIGIITTQFFFFFTILTHLYFHYLQNSVLSQAMKIGMWFSLLIMHGEIKTFYKTHPTLISKQGIKSFQKNSYQEEFLQRFREICILR